MCRSLAVFAVAGVVITFTVSLGRTMGYAKTCKSAVTVWVGCGYGVDRVRLP